MLLYHPNITISSSHIYKSECPDDVHCLAPQALMKPHSTLHSYWNPTSHSPVMLASDWLLAPSSPLVMIPLNCTQASWGSLLLPPGGCSVHKHCATLPHCPQDSDMVLSRKLDRTHQQKLLSLFINCPHYVMEIVSTTTMLREIWYIFLKLLRTFTSKNIMKLFFLIAISPAWVQLAEKNGHMPQLYCGPGPIILSLWGVANEIIDQKLGKKWDGHLVSTLIISHVPIGVE